MEKFTIFNNNVRIGDLIFHNFFEENKIFTGILMKIKWYFEVYWLDIDTTHRYSDEEFTIFTEFYPRSFMIHSEYRENANK